MQVRTHTRGENANAGVSAAGAGPGRKLSVLLSVRALV
jgi:hypothetical protein